LKSAEMKMIAIQVKKGQENTQHTEINEILAGENKFNGFHKNEVDIYLITLTLKPLKNNFLLLSKTTDLGNELIHNKNQLND
jgi:hypothetical protein